MRFLQYTLIAFFVLSLLAPQLSAQQPIPAPGDEAQLIAVLESDAELFDKAKACQRLAVVGSSKSVPALAALLGDDQMAHYARTGLEANPDVSVDAAFRAALERLQGRHLISVINSIGVRRDVEAVEALQALLANSDTQVAGAAAGALGHIATEECVDSLQDALTGPASLQPAVADACLAAAYTLIAEDQAAEAAELLEALQDATKVKYLQTAAQLGVIRARKATPLLVECLRSDDKALFQVGLRMGAELPGAEVTQALIDSLKSTQPSEDAAGVPYPRQALILHVLGARGDQAALGVVLEFAAGDASFVRLAAIRVLGELGDGSAAPVLLAAMVNEDGELAAAASESLVELSGADVDGVLEAMLSQSEGRAQLALIDLVGRRGITSAAPQLVKFADGDDAELRMAAIDALGSTVELDGLSALVDRLLAADTPELRAAVKESLRKACLRMPDRDMAVTKLLAPRNGASMESLVDVLDLLGVIGGPAALQAVTTFAVLDDAQLADAATRVLGEWITPDAAPVLLELATIGPEAFRVRCLRGFIRIPRQLNVEEDQRLVMCRQALAAATRDAEKRLVMEVAARYPSVDSLAIVEPYLDDAGVKAAAAAATVAIAQKIGVANPAAVLPALEKAVEAAGDDQTAARARALRNRASKAVEQ